MRARRRTQLFDTAHEVVENMMPDHEETLKAFGRHDRRGESRYRFHGRSQRSWLRAQMYWNAG